MAGASGQAPDKPAPRRAVRQSPQPQGAKAVRAAYDRRTAAFARKDADAVLALYHPNYRLVEEDPRVSEGLDRLRPFLDEIFKRSALVRVTTVMEKVRVRGDRVYARVREEWKLAGYNASPDAAQPGPMPRNTNAALGDVRYKDAVWARDPKKGWLLLREFQRPAPARSDAAR